MKKPFFISTVEDHDIGPHIGSLIRECFGTSSPKIYKKKQFSYLSKYLSRLSVRSIICETEYIDRDYLEDYSRYYIKCFGNYSRKCARLHFFSIPLNENFNDLLKRKATSLTTETLNDRYLGFIVIRPLPMAFIGRSCLKVYKNTNNKSSKCRLEKEYKANLFGISLTVQSIAFQEQDKVVSACATASLWSLFHAIHKDTIRHIPSPSEITLEALGMTSINGFPNEGLKQAEIIKVLENSSIKHHGKKYDSLCIADGERLAGSIKGYIDSKIPLLLGVSVYKNFKYFGEHLVTILGYWGGENSSSKFPIKGIYIHDDRIGPYIKAEIVTSPPHILLGENDSAITPQFSIIFPGGLPDQDEDKNIENITDILLPNALIVGTYQKIRIPYELIALTCRNIGHSINKTMQREASKREIPLTKQLIWDIKLHESSSLKRIYFNTAAITNRYDALTTYWPRFVWAATFYYGEESFDLLYDATDIPQGEAFVGIVKSMSEEVFNALINPLMLAYTDVVHSDDESTEENISFLFQTIRGLQTQKKGFFPQLNNLYGEPNLPAKIKPEEIENFEVGYQPWWEELYLHSSTKVLKDFFCDAKGDKLIWLISCYGVLVLGRDEYGTGHPTLSAGSTARIAGEIKTIKGKYQINHFSARYSQWYDHKSKCIYLQNVLTRFKEIFPNDDISIDPKARKPRKS